MTWLALSVLLIQAGWISLCVFDKVENFQGDFLGQKFANESGCFADCYENKDCIAITYIKSVGMCFLFRAGNHTIDCMGSVVVCYTLLRNEVDSVCQRYVDV